MYIVALPAITSLRPNFSKMVPLLAGSRSEAAAGGGPRTLIGCASRRGRTGRPPAVIWTPPAARGRGARPAQADPSCCRSATGAGAASSGGRCARCKHVFYCSVECQKRLRARLTAADLRLWGSPAGGADLRLLGDGSRSATRRRRAFLVAPHATSAVASGACPAETAPDSSWVGRGKFLFCFMRRYGAGTVGGCFRC